MISGLISEIVSPFKGQSDYFRKTLINSFIAKKERKKEMNKSTSIADIFSI